MTKKETEKVIRFSVSMKPTIQKVLKGHCEVERRNKSQMIEVMILDYKKGKK